MVKLADTALTMPLVGPVSVNEVAASAAYVIAAGLLSVPEFVGVSVTVPGLVGVIVNVCAEIELVNVRTIGVERPPPLGAMLIVPV
jgi:hypothetical protein